MTVIPSTLGSFAVAAIALFFAVSQLAASISIRRYRWGLWTSALSLGIVTYSLATFIQFNSNLLETLIAAERIRLISISWFVFLLAGFSRAYTADRRHRTVVATALIAALTTIIHWSYEETIQPIVGVRRFWLTSTPYLEAPVGPVGIALLAISAFSGLVVVFSMLTRLPRRGPSRRIIGFGVSVWMLTAINDLIGALGLQVSYFLLEYGFLVFLIAIQALIFVEHLRLHRIITTQHRRIRDSKRTLEQMVDQRTNDLWTTTAELIETLNRYRETESSLRRSMEEKEVLIKEIHHRTKNNLQVVSSLLNLTLERQVGPELQQVVRENQVRIMAMAMVHEQLYNSKNVARIEFGRYLENLVGTVAAAHRLPGCEISVDYAIEPVYFSIEQAVPLALWANEVITNSYKHAFRNTNEGTIRIELRRNFDAVELTITDSGPGIPQSTRGLSSGLGSHLIVDLPEQVDATLQYLDPPTFGYLVRVPIEQDEPAQDDTLWEDDTPSLFDQ